MRILTDVSAMLPSSGYTRLNTVRSSLNLAHVIDGILARVQQEIARYGARVSKRKKKGGEGDSRETKAGGSLRFSSGRQQSLTTGQRIGKARRALTTRGVRRHAPPENFEILWSQGCVFLHFEAADNDFQQPKKDNFSRQFNHD